MPENNFGGYGSLMNWISPSTSYLTSPADPFTQFNPATQGGFDMSNVLGNFTNAAAPTAGGPMSQFTNFWNRNGSAITGGLGAFSSLANIYAGFKALGLAKDQFKFQKQGTMRNFNANATAFNTAQEDRWRARDASARARGGSFESLGDYTAGRTVDKWGRHG